MLDLVLNNSTAEKKYSQDFFEKILEIAGPNAKSPSAGGISVNLVGEERIKSLNKKYRGKNEATDVLSFPINKRKDFSMKLKGDTIELGDIFICLPIAKKIAKSEKISIEKELARLTVHGFLHLLGYDHEDANDKGSMLKLQESIIEKWSAIYL